MKTRTKIRSVRYWLNKVEGNNNRKIQPRSKESDIACQVAEYLNSQNQEAA